MTASVFLAEPAILAVAAPDTLVAIDGPEARHAVSVVRMQPGEPIELVDGAGRRVRGVVESIRGSDHLEVRVGEVLDEAPPALRLVVVQALPKGDHGELAVDLMTQVGVDEIVPWGAQRSVAQWKSDRIEKSRSKWQAAATQAAKQSRRARIPVIAPLATTAGVCARVGEAALAIVLHEEAEHHLAGIPLPASGEVLLITGPEGGLSDTERQALRDAGAREALLGPTVLRSSLAGAVAVTVVSARAHWNDPGMEGSAT